jgi:hypothetical protein
MRFPKCQAAKRCTCSPEIRSADMLDNSVPRAIEAVPQFWMQIVIVKPEAATHWDRAHPKTIEAFR